MQILQVTDRDSWKAYHAIRRLVLFEMRGRADYDENQPDEYRDNHFPLLFVAHGRPAGTTRLDLVPEDPSVGIVRLVAIAPEMQGRGIGRAMMNAVEKFAVSRKLNRLHVHAAQDAVAFYEKLGWHLLDANRKSPLLGKDLT